MKLIPFEAQNLATISQDLDWREGGGGGEGFRSHINARLGRAVVGRTVERSSATGRKSKGPFTPSSRTRCSGSF